MSWGRHQRNRKKTLKADLKKTSISPISSYCRLDFSSVLSFNLQEGTKFLHTIFRMQKIVLCPDFKGRWKLKTKTIKTELQILKQLIVKVRQYHRRVVWKEVQKRLIKCDQILFFLAYWDLTIDHFTAPGCHCDLMSSDIQIFEC